MGILSAFALILPFAVAQTVVFDTEKFVIPDEYTHKASAFRVKLSSSPTGEVTYQVRANGIGRLSNCDVTFDPTNWNDYQTVLMQPAYNWNPSVSANVTVSGDSTTSLPTFIKNYQLQTCTYTGSSSLVGFGGSQTTIASDKTAWLIQSPRLSIQCQSVSCDDNSFCPRSCVVQYTDGTNVTAFEVHSNSATSQIETVILKDNVLAKSIRSQVNNANFTLFFPDGAQTTFAYFSGNDLSRMEAYINLPDYYSGVTSGLCSDRDSGMKLFPDGSMATNDTQWLSSWILDTSHALNQVQQARTLSDSGNLSNFTTISVNDMLGGRVRSVTLNNHLATMDGDGTLTFKSCEEETFGLPNTVSAIPTSVFTPSTTISFQMPLSDVFPGLIATNVTARCLALKTTGFLNLMAEYPANVNQKDKLFWTENDCPKIICKIMQTQYGVLRGNGVYNWGNLTNALKLEWEHPALACDLQIDDVQLTCQKIHEKRYVLPLVTDPKFEGNEQAFWEDNECDSKMCKYWHYKYSISAVSFGFLNSRSQLNDSQIRLSWDRMNCNEVINDYLLEKCQAISETYQLEPNVNWKNIQNLSPADWNFWGRVRCNRRICTYYKKKYQMTSITDFEKLPQNLRQSFIHFGTNCYAYFDEGAQVCTRIQEFKEYVPMIDNGTMIQEDFDLWNENDCDRKICHIYLYSFRIFPYGSKNGATSPHARAWDALNCDQVTESVLDNYCNYIHETYGIIPGVGWLKGPQDISIQTAWTWYNCDRRMCKNYREKYGLNSSEPDHLNRKLMELANNATTANIASSYVHPFLNCGTFDTTENKCRLLNEFSGVIPGVSNGTATPADLQFWADNNCGKRMCSYWRYRFNVLEGNSLGSLPASYVNSWNILNCDAEIGTSVSDVCDSITKLYPQIIPQVTFGTPTPPIHITNLWSNNRCTRRMCKIWKQQYGITNDNYIEKLIILAQNTSTASIAESYLQPWMNCYEIDDDTETRCRLINEFSGYIPGISNGTATASEMAFFNDPNNNCNKAVCKMLVRRNQLYENGSLRNVAANIKSAYTTLNCDSLLTGTMDGICDKIVTAYPQFILGLTWGTPMPPEFIRNAWNWAGCTRRACRLWKTKFGITNDNYIEKLINLANDNSTANIPMAYVHHQNYCFDTDDTDTRCRLINEFSGYIPGVSNGTASASEIAFFNDPKNNCTKAYCKMLVRTNQLYENGSLKNVAANIKSAYTTLNCDSLLTETMDGICDKIVTAYPQFILGLTWGTPMPPEFIRNAWNWAGCTRRVALMWKKQYQITNDNYRQKMIDLDTGNTSRIVTVYTNPSINGKDIDETENRCRLLNEFSGIIPTVTNGTASNTEIQFWYSNGCSQRMCNYWTTRYNMLPMLLQRTNIPASYLQSYKNMGCDQISFNSTKDYCIAIHEINNGTTAWSFGTTPRHEKNYWNGINCNLHVCRYLQTKYNVTRPTNYGTLPTQLILFWNGLHCDSYLDTLTARCRVISESGNYFPGVKNQLNTTSCSSDDLSFANSNCNAPLCKYWNSRFRVNNVFVSSTSSDIINSWNAINCPSLI